MKRWTFVALISLSIIQGTLFAATPEPARQLLTDAWSRKYSARKKVDAIVRSSVSDPTTQHAHLLVLVYQRRYREALPMARQLLSLPSHAHSARMTEIWVNVVTRKYEPALAAMNRLAGEVMTVPGKRQSELVTFMGRIMGFLDGPIRSKTTRLGRDRIRREIENKLGPALAIEFNKAHADVMKEYLDKAKDLAQAIVQGIEQEKKLRSQLKVDLAEIRKRTDEDQVRLEESVTRTEKGVERRQSNLRRQDLPLQRELDGLDDAAFEVRSDRARVTRRIWRNADRLNRTKTKGLRRVYRDRIYWLRDDLDRHDYELARLQRRANRTYNQRVQLANESARLRQQLYGARKAAQKARKKLDRRRNRATYEARRLKKPIRGHTARSHELKRRMSTLSTYVTLPLEKERAKLLGKK